MLSFDLCYWFTSHSWLSYNDKGGRLFMDFCIFFFCSSYCISPSEASEFCCKLQQARTLTAFAKTSECIGKDPCIGSWLKRYFCPVVKDVLLRILIFVREEEKCASGEICCILVAGNPISLEEMPESCLCFSLFTRDFYRQLSKSN